MIFGVRIGPKKYLITLWVDYYDLDGLTQDFRIEYDTDSLSKARSMLKEIPAKVIHEELSKYPNYTIQPLPKGKNPILVNVNKNNKVVAQAACMIAGTGVNKNYYYFDVVEFTRDLPITEKLFNLEFSEYEVKKFFESKSWPLPR